MDRTALDVYKDRIADLEAERDELKTLLESQGRDHAQPCGLGTLCPWCHAENLEAELAEANGLLDEVYRKVFGYDAYHPAYQLAEKVLYTLAKRKGVK